jgi:ABC-type multidrug transport system fused ATPase/permease subunit
MKERLDAIWEAARAIAQTPIKKTKRRRASKSKGKVPAADGADPAAGLEEGYQPPTLPEDENEEVTLQFANVNTMFGAYMHIHNHDEPDKPSGPPARPATADAAIQNTGSYSSSIRNKAKMGPSAEESDRPKTAPLPALAFQSPSRAPLLGGADESPGVTMSPLTTPTRLSARHADEALDRGTEMSALRSRVSEDSYIDSLESQPVSASAGQVVQIPAQMATTLSFSRLKFVPEGQQQAAPSLQGVSYKIQPGACCCIVEGNGEGNSSLLLQLLAGKLRVPGKTTGVICANDQRLGEALRYADICPVQCV